jgi:hypothetical protein
VVLSWGTEMPKAHTISTIPSATMAVLDGVMLGDGYYNPIRKPNGDFSDHSCYFELNQIASHRDWLETVEVSLQKVGFITRIVRISEARTRQKADGTTIRESELLKLRTWATTNLLTERKRWYPIKSKIVPRDIEISNPELVAHWFMGDGSSSICEDGRLRVNLSTLSFTVDDNEWLVSELNNKHQVNASLHYWRKKPYICIINEEGSKRFVDLVRPFIAPSFEYKLKTSEWHHIRCYRCEKEISGSNKLCEECRQSKNKETWRRHRQRAKERELGIFTPQRVRSDLWTPEEDNILRTARDFSTNREISKLLPRRSIRAIRLRSKTLGLSGNQNARRATSNPIVEEESRPTLDKLPSGQIYQGDS